MMKCVIDRLFLIFLILSWGCDERTEASRHAHLLAYVTNYADAMIEHSRDVYGTASPLFASAMDRTTLRLNTSIDTIVVKGVRTSDRAVTGANMIYDKSLFRLLYDLTESTGEAKYASAADEAIYFFFNACQGEVTDLFCWGEHLFWDFLTEDCGFQPNTDYHEAEVWPYWDKAYDAAPETVWRFTLAEWDHQIHDKTTGDFSRHARYTQHETFGGYDFPRYAGQLMERWSYSYARPENTDRPRREELRLFIETLFHRMRDNMSQSPSGLLIAGRSPKGDHNQVVWLMSNLELARCLEVAASVVDPKMARQMLDFAMKQDQDFLAAPHRLDSAGGGFAVTLHAATGLPRVRSMNQ
ncbi:MAG: hypothetical protein AAGA85_24680, partial [Bacteroidota bacterium]